MSFPRPPDNARFGVIYALKLQNDAEIFTHCVKSDAQVALLA